MIRFCSITTVAEVCLLIELARKFTAPVLAGLDSYHGNDMERQDTDYRNTQLGRRLKLQ